MFDIFISKFCHLLFFFSMAFCFLTLNDNFDKECRPSVPSCNYYTDSVSTSSSHYNYFEEGPNTSDLQVNYSYCNKTTGYQCSSSSNSHQGNMLYFLINWQTRPKFWHYNDCEFHAFWYYEHHVWKKNVPQAVCEVVAAMIQLLIMMTTSNGNIFCVTGHLCGEFTGPRWIPRPKASDAELWCFLWSASE